MREWLSGEKTLPEAARNWLADRTRFEVVLFLVVFLVQAYVSALVEEALTATVRGVSASLRTTSLQDVVRHVFPVVVSSQLLYLMLKMHRIATLVEELAAKRRGLSENVITAENGRNGRDPASNQETQR